MTRPIPWLLAALLAAGCTAAPSASLTLEADGPRYAVQRTWVIPHVLETSGRLASADLDADGVTYTASLIDKSGRAVMPIKLEAFELTLSAPDKIPADAETVYLAAELEVTTTEDTLKALHGGIDDDCDGLAGFAGRPHLLITVTEAHKDPMTLRFFGQCPTGDKPRTVGAGTVTDILDFAGMAICEQGVPARKAAKKAKKAAKKAAK